MTMRRLSLTVFLVLCVLRIAHALYYYPQLPERVASHFGASGQPDAWSTKTFLGATDLVDMGICAILILVISFGMSKIPVSLINLPNKDYWLSEEHRRETFDFLFCCLLWFGSVTVLLLLDISHQSFQVDLGKAASLSHPVISLGFYMGFIVVWCIVLFMKFARKGESPQTHAADADKRRR